MNSVEQQQHEHRLPDLVTIANYRGDDATLLDQQSRLAELLEGHPEPRFDLMEQLAAALERAELLGAILAQQDSILLPMTPAEWATGLSGALWRWKHNFLVAQVGYPFSAGPIDSDDAGRKRLERALDALAGVGLVALFGGGKGRTLRLTHTGDAIARAMVGLPNVNDSLQALRALAEESADAPRAYTGLRWLRNAPGQRDPESLLPGLVRGWADVAADVAGGVHWAVTHEGHAALDHPPPMPARLPRAIDGAREKYLTARAAARKGA